MLSSPYPPLIFNPGHLVGQRLGPRVSLDFWSTEKPLALTGTETPVRPAPCQVATPTTLFWLQERAASCRTAALLCTGFIISTLSLHVFGSHNR